MRARRASLAIAGLVAPLLAACLPTQPETVTCATDQDCASVRPGFTCDLVRHVCACTGTLDAVSCVAAPQDGGALEAPALACTLDAGCPASTPICSGEGLCTGCTTDEQCRQLGDRSRAFCASGACVACVSSAGCGPDQPICSDHACHPCTTALECADLHDEARALCSPAGTCVGCLTSASCPPSQPICSNATGTCTVCVASKQCAAVAPDRPVCTPLGACVECASDADCPAPAQGCDPVANRCLR